MQTDKEFEDFFRERLNGLEETPPPMAWGKIQADIKPKKRTYYREMAAVILLFLVSTGIFFGVRNLNGISPEARENLVSSETTKPRTNAGNFNNQKQKNTDATAGIKSGEINAAESLRSNADGLVSPQKNIENPEIANSGKTTTSFNAGSGNMPSGVILADKDKPVNETGKDKENWTENHEVTSAQNTRITNAALALSSGKRYPSTVKNSPETASANSGSNTSITKAGEIPVPAQNQVAAINSENATSPKPASEENTTLAQNPPARTDSVALPAIPSLADSVINLASSKLEKQPKEKQKHEKLAVTVNFTPGVISRRLIANPNDDKYLRFSDANNEENGADLGFDLSATLHHRVSNKTTIDGGFSYTKLHSNVNYQISSGQLNVITSPTGNNSGNVKVGYAFADEKSHNEFAYGGIRLGLSQELVKSATKTIFVSGGAGLNMLLSNSGRIYTSSGTTSATTESVLESNAFHTVNSHLYVSAGLTQKILPKVSVLIAPAFTYYLNSAMRKQYIFELKPYTFGLNFGLRCQL